MTKLLVKLFVKNNDNVNDVKVRSAYGTLSGVVGIICNFILSLSKIAVGVIIGSISVMADGLNNLSDMGSGLITMVGFKMAAKPADKDHPFGHGRMEYLSAFVVAMLILLVGFELIKSSVEALIAGEPAPKYPIIVYIVLGISVVVKFWLFVFNKKLGKKLSSDALFATSQDSRNDAIATVVIILSAVCSRFVPAYINLDAIMGLLVGLFIIYSGIGAAKETVDKLLGQPPEEELIAELEKIILSFSDFSAIHDLIVHNYGPGRCLASVHVEVSQNIDIVHCHEQVDLCEKLIGEKLGILLTIHSDPIDVDNEAVNAVRMALSEKVKNIHQDVTIHDFRMTPLANERTNLIFDAVLPSEANIDEKSFKERINSLAREINPTFVCVITVDKDYIGK